MIKYLQPLFESTKPQLTSLSVLTALCGYLMGSTGDISWTHFILSAAGIWLAASSAGSLNQYFERLYDARMKRTLRRPLPSRRIPPNAVILYGVGMAVVGLSILYIWINSLTAFLGALTLLMYLGMYTPLKRRSTIATLIGAIAGALPPLMGWTAATGKIELYGLLLFSVLYFWQFPHFLALGWMYREDYWKAGFVFVNKQKESAAKTGLLMLVNSLILIIITALITVTGKTGLIFMMGATLAGIGLAYLALGYFVTARRDQDETELNRKARELFLGSIAYLPIIMVMMLLDKSG